MPVSKGLAKLRWSWPFAIQSGVFIDKLSLLGLRAGCQVNRGPVIIPGGSSRFGTRSARIADGRDMFQKTPLGGTSQWAVAIIRSRQALENHLHYPGSDQTATRIQPPLLRTHRRQTSSLRY